MDKIKDAQSVDWASLYQLLKLKDALQAKYVLI
ncbi:hypothetical protein K08M4_05200 [Vibrio syngnathi]|uniref:Uncharacterized protein n=1 Tax=Vibrio syngnathi TaxID=3034029 RepID=A0AA34TMR6_9VIBR|nr:hypothetical protein K08M4_05200 [Vibrio syngnathi]